MAIITINVPTPRFGGTQAVQINTDFPLRSQISPSFFADTASYEEWVRAEAGRRGMESGLATVSPPEPDPTPLPPLPITSPPEPPPPVEPPPSPESPPPPPPPTTTGVTAPTTEQLEFLENIRTQANAGGFARRDNVIAAVRSVMQLGNNVAGWAEASALYERWIEPDLNAGVFTGNVTAGADGGGGGAVDGDGDGGGPVVVPTSGPQSRLDLFGAQRGDELTRRLIANAFGTNLSPLAGRAAGQTVSRFNAIDPFLEFKNPRQTLGARFQGFAGGARPTGTELGTTLESLLVAADDPNSAFLDVVPDFQTAASVGLQPGIANLNPRLRSRLSSRVLDKFATSMAQAPEQFQTASASNLAAQIQAFRSRFQGF